MEWFQAGSFFVQSTQQGQLVFEVPAVKEEPKTPYLFYDGQDNALLYRNKHNGLVLDYINPKIRETLKSSKEVLIIEMDLEKGGIERSYPVSVKAVSKVNIKLSKEG